LMMVVLIAMIVVNNSVTKAYAFRTVCAYIIFGSSLAAFAFYVIRAFYGMVIPAH
jgi:hypothetical protein